MAFQKTKDTFLLSYQISQSWNLVLCINRVQKIPKWWVMIKRGSGWVMTAHRQDRLEIWRNLNQVILDVNYMWTNTIIHIPSSHCLVHVHILQYLHVRLMYNYYALTHAYNAAKTHAQGSDQACWSPKNYSLAKGNWTIYIRLWLDKRSFNLLNPYPGFPLC